MVLGCLNIWELLLSRQKLNNLRKLLGYKCSVDNFFLLNPVDIKTTT